MIHFKNIILFGTSFCVLCFVRCLAEVSVDNDLMIAESSIRKTFNNLFASFKIPVVTPNSKLKEFSTIHNFLVSITLSDGENLQKIVELSRVYDIDNNIQHFMTQIYEIFTDGNKNNEVPDDKYVDKHIIKFIKNLRDLKKNYSFNREFANYSINSNILKYLKKSDSKENITDDSFDDLWKPTEPSGRRIYQGHRTRIKHYPFIVSVHFFERFQCAGSIIRNDLVITAASCLQLAWNNRFFRENPSFLSVQVGSNFYEAHGETIPIYEIYFHPDYTPKTLANNLAIMRLGTHIIFNKKRKKVKRVEIDRNPAPMSINTDGIIIVGWGARDHNNVVYDPWVNKLSYAELSYYSLVECQEVYSKEFVTIKNFCAGFFSRAGGACQHDIGGPGIAAGILAGVISFGPPTCGTPDAPTVFTKIGYYADWIDEIMDMPVPVVFHKTTLLHKRQTIGGYYSDRTTRIFNFKPMIENVEELKSNLSDNVDSKKSLRILGDDQRFNEFMGTLFDGSNYNDNPEIYEDNKTTLNQTKYNNNILTRPVTATLRSKAIAKKTPKMRAELIKPDLNVEENSNLVTDISNIETSRSNEEYVPKIKNSEDNIQIVISDVSEDQSKSVDNDPNMEKDIMELLDDIDIHKIMESKEFLTSSNEDRNVTQSIEHDNDKNKTLRAKSKEILNSNVEDNNKILDLKSEELLSSSDKDMNKMLHMESEELLSRTDKDKNKTLHIVSKEPVNISEKDENKPLLTESKGHLSNSDNDRNFTLRAKEDNITNKTNILTKSSESSESTSYSCDESISGDQSLEFPTEEYNDISIAEAKIRETANILFATFKIKDVGHKPRLKDFSTIHSFFVSITLKDCENLKKIVRLSRVYNFDNNTSYLITQINELLNQNDNNKEVADDLHVNTLIEIFIDKLRALKKTFIFDSNFANFSINSKILDHFQSQRLSHPNTTSNSRQTHDTEEEIWKPTEASGRRIFNGRRTRIKHYPFMASIQFFERFQCAGNIIKKDLVLTAASCLQLAWNNRFFRENPSFLSVQVGSDFYEAAGEHIPVLEIYFHPEYVPKTLHNNLALMRLITHIVFSKKHKNVKRVIFDERPSPLAINTNGIIIVGWGARDRTNTVYDPWLSKLSFAELDYYPLQDCQEVYSKDYVTRKNFCAGFFSKAGGACQHDIGGPALVGGILVGVISFGPPTCGTPDAPTVFTKVGFYKDWINSVVEAPAHEIVRLTTLKENTITVNFAPHYSDKTTKRFSLEPLKFDETTTQPSYNLRMGLAENSLKVLEDDKLFKEFLSTMFEKEDNEYLGISNIVNKLNMGDSKKNSQKTARTVSTTSTTELPPTLSDYTYEDEDAEMILSNLNEVKANTAKFKTFTKTILAENDLTPLLSSDGDKGSEIIIAKNIAKKMHSKSIKPYTRGTRNEINIKKKLIKSTTEGLIRIPINVSHTNVVNNNPIMKAIEDNSDKSIDASDSEETLKLLDDDNLFEELLSTLLENNNKNNSLSEDKTVIDKPPIKSNNNSVKKQNPKTRKSTVKTTKTSHKMDYEDTSEDANVDASENEDETRSQHGAKTNAAIINLTSVHTYIGTDQGEINTDESTLEKDITDLLDDLDLRKLLESDEPSSSSDNQEELSQQEMKKRVLDIKMSSSSSNEYSSEDNNDDDVR